MRRARRGGAQRRARARQHVAVDVSLAVPEDRQLGRGVAHAPGVVAQPNRGGRILAGQDEFHVRQVKVRCQALQHVRVGYQLLRQSPMGSVRRAGGRHAAGLGALGGAGRPARLRVPRLYDGQLLHAACGGGAQPQAGLAVGADARVPRGAAPATNSCPPRMTNVSVG